MKIIKFQIETYAWYMKWKVTLILQAFQEKDMNIYMKNNCLYDKHFLLLILKNYKFNFKKIKRQKFLMNSITNKAKKKKKKNERFWKKKYSWNRKCVFNVFEAKK